MDVCLYLQYLTTLYKIMCHVTITHVSLTWWKAVLVQGDKRLNKLTLNPLEKVPGIVYSSTRGHRTVCSLPITKTKTNKSIWCASLQQQVPLCCWLMLPEIRRELCSQLPGSGPIRSKWLLPPGQSCASHCSGLPLTPPPAESSHGCGQTGKRKGKWGGNRGERQKWELEGGRSSFFIRKV